MKLIRLTTSLDFGGVEKRIEISAKEFITREDVKLYVVAIGKGGAISNALTELGIETILLNESYKIPSIRTIFRLYRLFKKIKPDVVHTSGAEANFHGLIAAFFAGVKMRIGEEIGFPNHHAKWQKVFRITYGFANKVIGISQAVVDKIVELGEVKLEKAVVVHNPVAIKDISISIKQSDEKELIFISVSRLVAIKNLDHMIKSFRFVLNHTDIPLKLHIVGDGPEKSSLTELVNTLGIADKVIFFGFQENINNFLGKADVYLLPSFSEGFSIALVEAMLARLTCIATNVGGPVEIVNNSITGFLINPNDKEDLQKHMLHVLNLTTKQRDDLGIQARKEVLRRFTPQIYVDKLLAIYENG